MSIEAFDSKYMKPYSFQMGLDHALTLLDPPAAKYGEPTKRYSAPVSPYGDLPGHHASATSAAGARAVKPRVGSLQLRVLQALHDKPGLTSRGLDRMLGTTTTRSAWPRISELRTAGCVEQVSTCQEETGVFVSMWALTAQGEARLREMSK